MSKGIGEETDTIGRRRLEASTMKTKARQNIILLFATVLLCWLGLEVAMRLLIVPSTHSYGRLLGVELPPLKLVIEPSSSRSVKRSTWYKKLVVDGQRITVGDLMGVYRKDPLIGYVPQENTISVNRWWQTNNLGARSRQDMLKNRPDDQKRMLVFGDSFAAGSRVRQEATWTSILDAKTSNWRIVNFGVDGYGMGQAFLRYRQMKAKLDYDVVLLMFVPGTDLWRDINVKRDVGGNWATYTIMPRFVIENNELKLIKNPFFAMSYKHGRFLEKNLKNHLAKYDRFYSRLRYEDHFLIGNCITYKMFVTVLYKFRRDRLRNTLMHPDSEAMQISKKIFEAMHTDVKNDGKQFILVILPTHHDLELFKQGTSYRHTWHKMVASICHDDFVCIDLSTDLTTQKDDDLDKSYDNTHYGPKANYLISQLIENRLKLH